MQFESGFLYHIFNRGNNSRKIFFNHDNYIYFLQKLRKHIIPYCDILAWCLMPNHFHLMVSVKYTILDIGIEKQLALSDRMTSSHPITRSIKIPRTLNNSIGIMLRSYTRAIQKQENTTGSLFQSKTKAECINCPKGITPAWFQSAFGAIISTSIPELEYPKLCFEYIHNNPVSAGLVNELLNWEYSSARDYFGKREGSLINRELAGELGLV